MLKKKYRLNIKEKLKFSNSLGSHFFTLKVVKNNLLFNRYGFVVSKRVDKKAVVRNRVRRIFQNCVRDNFDRIEAGHDLLFYIKKNALSVARDQICFSLKDALREVGYLK